MKVQEGRRQRAVSMRGDRSSPIMKIAPSKNQERILVVPAAIFKSEGDAASLLECHIVRLPITNFIAGFGFLVHSQLVSFRQFSTQVRNRSELAGYEFRGKGVIYER